MVAGTEAINPAEEATESSAIRLILCIANRKVKRHKMGIKLLVIMSWPFSGRLCLFKISLTNIEERVRKIESIVEIAAENIPTVTRRLIQGEMLRRDNIAGVARSGFSSCGKRQRAEKPIKIVISV